MRGGCRCSGLLLVLGVAFWLGDAGGERNCDTRVPKMVGGSVSIGGETAMVPGRAAGGGAANEEGDAHEKKIQIAASRVRRRRQATKNGFLLGFLDGYIHDCFEKKRGNFAELFLTMMAWIPCGRCAGERKVFREMKIAKVDLQGVCLHGRGRRVAG